MRVLLPLVALVSLFVQPVGAESITINSGVFLANASRDFEPGFLLNGLDFHMGGGAPTPTEFTSPTLTNAAIGASRELSATLRITSDSRVCQFCRSYPGLTNPFELVLRGSSYQQTPAPGPPQTPLYTGTFRFTALFENMTAGLNVGTFSFVGNVLGRGDSFDLALTGKGTAEAGYTNFSDGRLLFNSLTLTFAGTPVSENGTPISTPEPSTWLLLASGLGALVWRRLAIG